MRKENYSMKRAPWLLFVILILGATVQAQEVPRVEISGGYSLLDANVNGTSFRLNGGNVSATENLNKWFGGRLEFNAFSGTTSGTSVTAQTITYGPVFAYRKFERMTPFGHLQIGAIHASQGYLGISQSATKFALASGGGVDFNLNERFAFRVQGDYLMSRFLNLRQDNLMLSTGLVVRFGRK
jgi:opacity protein-like surface antigen